MKKLIAVLMAMMMVFSCVPALAEAPAGTNELSIELPSFTITSEMTIDEEQANALLPALGLPEEYAGLVQMLLPMLNGLGEQLIFADNGVQYDLKMKGQDVLSLVAEAAENGFALATDLVPSYALTIQNATIQKVIEQLTAQTEEAMGKLDMELIQQAAEKIMGYAMEFASVYQTALTFGEPVKGEYADVIEGVVFNTETALTVDVKAIMEASQQFVTKALSDETVGAAIQSVIAMVPGASFDPAAVLGEITAAPEEYLPDVTGLVYTITDDEGSQTAADTYVIVNAVGKEDASGNTNTYVYVNETSVDINVEIPAQQVAVEVYIEQAEAGATVNIALSAPGFDAELALAVSMTETGLTLDGALYIGEAEAPILVFYEDFTMGGERAKSALDGEKTELALDGLLDEENASDLISALLGDVMMNGLSTVINNVKNVLPEQGAMLEQLVGSLMGALMGGAAAEVPAE